MKFIFRLLILIFPIIIFAQNENKAFTPWYTGTLYSYSGNSIGKRNINIQPYFTYYKQYSDPKVNAFWPLLFFQVGLSDYFDIEGIADYIYKENDQTSVFKFQDLLIGAGYQILKEKEFTLKPSIRLFIQEIFPTGKYKNLDPIKNKIDASGQGSYETIFGVAISKIFYWFYYHPINLRYNLFYSVNTKAKVENFNTYGGGFNTFGKVKVGNTLCSIISLEYSFNQRWVYAMDLMYSYTSKSTFKGREGFDEFGLVADNNNPCTSELYVAPAIEYNFNQNLGFITGVNLPLSVKNTSKTISFEFSVNYVFPVR